MRCVRLVVAAAGVALVWLSSAGPSLASGQIVEVPFGSPGQIIVRTQERQLYFVIGDGRAIRYPVGVGRIGMQWAGASYVDGKYVRPAWSPPALVRHDHPRMPTYYPGGAPNNPMGAAALTLNGGEYAIHGTNQPGSIGRFVSYGCIRMHNADVVDLYNRVLVGTLVLVTE